MSDRAVEYVPAGTTNRCSVCSTLDPHNGWVRKAIQLRDEHVLLCENCYGATLQTAIAIVQKHAPKLRTLREQAIKEQQELDAQCVALAENYKATLRKLQEDYRQELSR